LSVEDKTQPDTTQVTADPPADDAVSKSSSEDKIQPGTTHVTVDPPADDAAEDAAKLGDKNVTIDGAGNADITATMPVDKHISVDSIDGDGDKNFTDYQYGSSYYSSYRTAANSEPKPDSDQKPSTIKKTK
jgi:hypothetical protein